MTPRTTPDGLPIVTEETINEFLEDYDPISPEISLEVATRIERENPEIRRILLTNMQQATSPEARAYFEGGVQAAYELLRRQSIKDKPA